MPNFRKPGENCSIFNCYGSRAHPGISFLRIPTKNDDKIKLEEQHYFSVWLWLDIIMGVALFLKLFPKTGRKWILFKFWKRIKVSGHMHFEHIFFFRVCPWIFEFKVILKLFPEQIQNSGLNPVKMPYENLAYYDSWYIQNPGILRTWGIFRIP